MKYFFLLLGSLGVLAAQPTVCFTTSGPVLARAEGLTERVGDIVYNCTGAPGAAFNVNLSVELNTPVTNRSSSGNTVTGTVLTVDSGSGPQAVLVQPILQSQNQLIWDGVPIAISPQGTFTIRIADVRANAVGIGVGGQIIAVLSMDNGSILISQSSLEVAVVETSLYEGSADALICAQNGSPLASTAAFSSLIQEGTALASTRLTEGFASAFEPKSALPSLNADTGTRFLIRYTGFPQAAQLFVPNVVAGSDAVQPTAGGDLGLTASGGSYAPSNTGSLLLALVAGADSTGAGGSLVYTPGAVGSGTVSFDSVTALTIVNGAAYAVYEVVDSNPSALESAQFPTFLGLAPNAVANAVETGEQVTYAPVSSVMVASATAAIPRFVGAPPPNDCGIIGDCGASYFPQLTVSPATLAFSLPMGSPNQVQYLPVKNGGGGILYWAVGVSYTNGSGWLTVDPASGTNNGTIGVYANPGSLAVGSYQAMVTVDGGTAGRRIVMVTLTITQAVTLAPQITAIENAASFAQVPVVAGSLTTIMGSSFTGTNLSVTFNGQPATIVFSNATQINLLVPVGLGTVNSVQVAVSVGQLNSLPVTVAVAPFEPGIFAGAVLNQDSTVNSLSNAAAGGSVMYFYATGLSGQGTISVRIGGTEITNLYYAGPAPGFPGVQQINVTLPQGLGAVTTPLSVCGTGTGGEVCSPPYSITLK